MVTLVAGCGAPTIRPDPAAVLRALEGNLVRGFEAEGFRVLVFVPFLPEWEAALRRRFGRQVGRNWYEVLPGVLRPPFVGDEEVLAIPPPEPEASEVTLPR